MGFTTGFIGGVALTSTLLYVTLSVHERTRLTQSQILARQAILLDKLVAGPQQQHSIPGQGESRVAAALRRRAAADQQPGVAERFKERWNRELEDGVMRVYAVDWRGVRERLEERVAGIWGGALEGAREGVDKA